MSLRALWTVAIATVAALVALGAVCFALLSNYLHDVAASLRASVESVRVAHRLEVDLLLHDRMTDPFGRRNLEASLRRTLAEARQYVETSEEGALLRDVEQRVAEYLDLWRAGDARAEPFERLHAGSRPLVEAAYLRLDDLVALNVEQARAAEADADRLARLSTVAGVTAAGLLLAGLLMLLIWLRTYALKPLLGVRAAMDRFAAGDRTSRAAEHGPAELREMARQFNDMASALARQRQNQLQFLAAVAHELRNPLGALQASADLVRPDRELPPENLVRQALSVVSRQVRRLDRMLGDLLDATRIEAGRLELRLEESDGREIARGVHELFRSASERHRLDLSVPDEPVRIRCDPLRIEQVLNNLVSNAIKYSPQGGAVELRLGHTATEAVFSVADEGAGIAETERQAIFEPFRRGASGGKGTQGVGLGLSVSRRIVEAHGGRIDFQSAPREGSTFHVRLPLALEARTS